MEDQYSTALEGHHFFNEFNPGVGITRKLGDTFALGNTTVYATYKESSRNPSVAELGCADPLQPCRLPNSFQADPPLDEVKNRSFEFGARGTNDGLDLFGLITVLVGMQQHLLEETSTTSFSLVEIELVQVILETLVILKGWGQS